MFDWGRAFINTKVNKIVFIFKKTILHLHYNFIPHGILIVYNKDLTWVTKYIKNFILQKDNAYLNIKTTSNIQFLRRLKFQ